MARVSDERLPAAHADTAVLTRRERAVLCVLGVWIAAWMWLGRYHMLDDALIHLRYAEQLRLTGHITYNGEIPNYGASSLLYVALLSAGRRWCTSALLPKSVSSGIYLGLLVVVVWRAVRTRSWAGRSVWALSACTLSGPLGVRWLSDGMETSSTLAAALGFTLLMHRLARERVSFGAPWLSGVVAGLCVSLRVELAWLVGAISLAAYLWARAQRGSWVGSSWRFVPSWLAASAVLAGLWMHYGRLLPDTALAKAVAPPFAAFTAIRIVTSLGSAGSFGCGMVAVWIASAWLVFLRVRGDTLRTSACALANALLPGLLLATLARGQLPSIRYVAWAVFGSCAWNALTLEACAIEVVATRERVRVLCALACGLLALGCVESVVVPRIFAARSATYLRMSQSDWSGFAGARAVAADIGFFGYFSETHVCDLNGLVNGPEFAALSHEQRGQRCASRHLDVAFLIATQRPLLSRWLDLNAWRSCGHLDFPNLNLHSSLVQRYELLLHPSSKLACPAGLDAK